MGLRFMEHLLILTPDPDGTRDWWCEVLGMREGDHPDFGFPVHWLYIGDQDARRRLSSTRARLMGTTDDRILGGALQDQRPGRLQEVHRPRA